MAEIEETIEAIKEEAKRLEVSRHFIVEKVCNEVPYSTSFHFRLFRSIQSIVIIHERLSNNCQITISVIRHPFRADLLPKRDESFASFVVGLEKNLIKFTAD